MHSPTISAVIPTYNRAHLIGRAIRSALAALRPGDEVIVVDDGSQDDTAAVVRSFGDAVRFLPMPHGGAGVTRNHGIQAARGDLVAFLDSDDEWDADKLDVQRAFHAARPEVVYSFTDFRVQEANGKRTPGYLAVWRDKDTRPFDEVLGPAEPFSSIAALPVKRPDFACHTGDLYPQLMHSFFVSTNTMVVRRELAGDAFQFGENVAFYEDLECFARLAKVGPVAFLDTETATQHGHDGPRLTDRNTDEVIRSRLTVMGRVWGRDAAYLEKHGPHYQSLVKELRMTRAKWLLVHGRTAEAGQAMRETHEYPLGMRFLATLPGPITKALLRIRRSLRRT